MSVELHYGVRINVNMWICDLARSFFMHVRVIMVLKESMGTE